MTEKERDCIKILVSNKDTENGMYTCFYDNKSGFLHVSFNQLNTIKTLKALIVLMESFNWQIVGINDHNEYGHYDYVPGLKTLKAHPKYSNNWSYVLFKCNKHEQEVYNVGKINKLNPFLSSMLVDECGKFNENWEIKGTTYLTDTTLQDKVDLCIYTLLLYEISRNFEYKQLSLGLIDGVFRLYESDGIGN